MNEEFCRYLDVYFIDKGGFLIYLKLSFLKLTLQFVFCLILSELKGY